MLKIDTLRKFLFSLSTVVVSFLTFIPTISAANFYVDNAATGTNAGTSWTIAG